MNKIDEKRFFTMAEAYDKMAPKLVPQYDFIQDEMIRSLGIKNYKNPVIIDLGAGSGIFIDKILNTNPTAVCYWVDYSEDFLKVAKNKLSKYGDKVKVYSVGAPQCPYSCEICAGPHIQKTGELGHFKILKEEASSAGVRRIKAVVE